MMQGVDMKQLSRATFLGLFLGMSLLLGRAAEEKPKENGKLPSAKEVLEKYSKAIGGKAAFARHESQHAFGKVELPAQKISGQLEVFAARPNKLIMKINMPGLGDMTTGYSG